MFVFLKRNLGVIIISLLFLFIRVVKLMHLSLYASKKAVIFTRLHSRLVNIMSHGAYSLFEPTEMVEENKEYFKSIFNNYLSNYKFNELLFAEENPEPLV